MGSGLLRTWGQSVTTRRHRLPAWLDRGVERAKWAVSRGGSGTFTMPPLESPSGRPARVLVGPANFAGQGWQWARALEGAGVPAVCWAFVADPRFAYPADHTAELAVVNRASRAAQRESFDRVVATVDAVVIEAGRPLFGRLFGYDPVAEASALQRAGVRVALLCHGTDVRVPSAHAQRRVSSPYALPERRAQTRAIESVALRNRRRLAGFRGPVLVSTPDLLLDVPGATWCPVVVDPARWETDRAVLDGAGPPLVVHVPSNPWTKGSDLVEPGVRAMADAGTIRYESVTGLPAAEVASLYTRADVVLDQFRLGIYGVAACEALAAGRLVVSDVDDHVRRAVLDGTGLALPVVQASAAEVPEVLAATLEDADRARALAAAGPAFVRVVHDGRMSADVLRGALDV